MKVEGTKTDDAAKGGGARVRNHSIAQTAKGGGGRQAILLDGGAVELIPEQEVPKTKWSGLSLFIIWLTKVVFPERRGL